MPEEQEKPALAGGGLLGGLAILTGVALLHPERLAKSNTLQVLLRVCGAALLILLLLIAAAVVQRVFSN
jgi:nitrate reductase gamma subunit